MYRQQRRRMKAQAPVDFEKFNSADKLYALLVAVASLTEDVPQIGLTDAGRELLDYLDQAIEIAREKAPAMAQYEHEFYTGRPDVDVEATWSALQKDERFHTIIAAIDRVIDRHFPEIKRRAVDGTDGKSDEDLKACLLRRAAAAGDEEARVLLADMPGIMVEDFTGRRGHGERAVR